MTETITQTLPQTMQPASHSLAPLGSPGSPESPGVPRFLSAEACAALYTKVRAFRTGSGLTQMSVHSHWTGDLRWARNRLWVAGDRQDTQIVISCGGSDVETNVWDNASLQAAVRMMEREDQEVRGREKLVAALPRATFTYPTPAIWSESTYTQTPEIRNVVAQRMVVHVEQAGMLSSGYISVLASGQSIQHSDGLALYAPQTIAQCSLTVRDPEGSGSGWAGASSYDWARFDAEKLAAIALDKCLRSRHPVAIEPGRYTVILEPQATFQLASLLINFVDFFRGKQENGDAVRSGGVYWDHAGDETPDPADPPVRLGFSKLGRQVVDSRITISHDPMDPELGVLPFNNWGQPYRAVTWIDHGVLTNIATDIGYALEWLQSEVAYPNSGAFRMSGGAFSIEEMIATTKRGLLVTRFSKMNLIYPRGGLWTGLTRDGLWLIENGKLSKAVKNFRFTESPFFVFNNVEQLGMPVPVFSPGTPAIVPPVKVRDFSFTGLVDAV